MDCDPSQLSTMLSQHLQYIVVLLCVRCRPDKCLNCFFTDETLIVLAELIKIHTMCEELLKQDRHLECTFADPKIDAVQLCFTEGHVGVWILDSLWFSEEVGRM